jgi:hypothetical protein
MLVVSKAKLMNEHRKNIVLLCGLNDKKDWKSHNGMTSRRFASATYLPAKVMVPNRTRQGGHYPTFR